MDPPGMSFCRGFCLIVLSREGLFVACVVFPVFSACVDYFE